MDPTKIMQYIQLIQMLIQMWMQMQGHTHAATSEPVDYSAQMQAINKKLAELLS